MEFFGGLLDLSMWHPMIRTLQATDKQRWLLLLMHQRKSNFRQHYAIGIAQ